MPLLLPLSRWIVGDKKNILDIQEEVYSGDTPTTVPVRLNFTASRYKDVVADRSGHLH
jgi:hypothetical protein